MGDPYIKEPVAKGHTCMIPSTWNVQNREIYRERKLMVA